MDIITVEKRNTAKKAKQLRRSGFIPCVISGGALKEALSVQLEKTAADKLFKLNREGSRIQIKLDDQIIPVQIKEKNRDFLSNELIHISFQALEADQKVNSIAHIILHNAEKTKGVLEKTLLEIPYSALPADMIDTVPIDLDGLTIGTIITVSDISV
ncbi:MAG: 50S ribosomal protein L25/general stress protein Ctc, partial [Eubacterium sp.]